MNEKEICKEKEATSNQEEGATRRKDRCGGRSREEEGAMREKWEGRSMKRKEQ